jgi:hypothetical protein
LQLCNELLAYSHQMLLAFHANTEEWLAAHAGNTTRVQLHFHRVSFVASHVGFIRLDGERRIYRRAAFKRLKARWKATECREPKFRTVCTGFHATNDFGIATVEEALVQRIDCSSVLGCCVCLIRKPVGIHRAAALRSGLSLRKHPFPIEHRGKCAFNGRGAYRKRVKKIVIVRFSDCAAIHPILRMKEFGALLTVFIAAVYCLVVNEYFATTLSAQTCNALAAKLGNRRLVCGEDPSRIAQSINVHLAPRTPCLCEKIGIRRLILLAIHSQPHGVLLAAFHNGQFVRRELIPLSQAIDSFHDALL